MTRISGYQSPVSEILRFEAEDVITLSGTNGWPGNGNGNKDDKPGNGFGDTGHNHTGAPGQNKPR